MIDRAAVEVKLATLARSVPFRAGVAAAILLLHLGMHAWMGAARFHLPFNNAPGAAPVFRGGPSEPMLANTPANWNRLLVSRWDSQHYMGTALRGFSQCPKQDLSNADLPSLAYRCDFNFYPAYGFVAGWLSFGTLPVDYVMFAIALLGSFIFLFLWTGPTIVDALGLKVTWLALLLYNLFPTSYTLVNLLTEPTVFALTMGSFVALAKRRYLLGAMLAGAASGVRISGAAVGGAFGVALLASLLLDRPGSRRAWIARIGAMALCCWGLVAMLGFYGYEYSDPLLYVHSHKASYLYMDTTSISARLTPSFFFAAANQPSREILWMIACLFWLALGYREAMAPFPPLVRVWSHVFTVLGTAISAFGVWGIHFQGMNRYWLLIFPVFFSMATVMKSRPLVFVLWASVCAWAYWNIELCAYIGQYMSQVCGF